MRWILRLITLHVLISMAAPSWAYGQTFSASGWLEDFAQLKQEMTAHYANLGWAIESRGLDLKQLSEGAESRLKRARSDAEAQEIIESFLAAFGDAHLNIEWPAAGGGSIQTSSGPQSTSTPPLCSRLGYRSQTVGQGIVFSRLNEFREIKTEDSRYFPIGILRFPGKKRVGVIRIALFSEYAFLDLCERATAEMGLTRDSACDEDCDDRVERKAADLLTAALSRQITALKHERIAALLVDITGNGGGTNWVEPAARTLTPAPLRSPRVGFIRHEHWVRQLRARMERIEADIARSSPTQRSLLIKALAGIRKAISEAQRTCHLDIVWQNLKPSCSLVVTDPPLYPQSVLSYAKPGELRDIPSSRYVFYPSRYTYREGVYSGALMVLVDQGTASSAEYFTAMLRDNNAARVFGLPTAGAGCGYTNRGIPTLLKNSGGRVKMPDCVRFRADGSNEVAGITPDVLIPWRSNDSRYQRAKRVFDALHKTLMVGNSGSLILSERARSTRPRD